MRPRLRVRVAVHLCLILLVGIIFTPILFVVVKATQSLTEAASPSLVPGGDLWTNVSDVVSRFGLGRQMANTLLLVVLITVSKTALSFMAATAFAFHRIPLSGPLFLIVLFTLLLPTEVLIIALYDLVVDLGLFDTYAGLVVPFMASATGTLLFRQHFLRISRDLVDAAKVDGVGVGGFIRSVLVPLSWNIIAALGVVEFVYVWNGYLWPLLVIEGSDRQVVQVGLSRLASQVDVSHQGVLMAGVLVAMIPPLLVFMALQESFIRGFQFSGDK